MSPKPNLNVSDWLKQNAIEHICVVSPHLDDAVYSVCGLLQSDAGARCQVTTVFTEADSTANLSTSWAQRTGFRNASQEYQVRRQEDQTAMNQLRVKWNHAGVSPNAWSPQVAFALAQQLIEQKCHTGSLLVLLPAGAGGPRPGRIGALWRRCLRRPFGSPPHGEHCAVRDGLLTSLPQIKTNLCVFVGFYAELPYLWADSASALSQKLELIYSQKLSPHWLQPNIAEKLSMASLYASQLVPILGTSIDYQKRTLGHDELYLLPGVAMKKRAAIGGEMET